MHMIKLLVQTGISLLLLTACVKVQAVSGQSSPIPAMAPDSIPADILKRADPEYRIPLDIVVITFRKGVAHASKEQAIRSLNGSVVGGVRINPATGVDGAYLVRIPTTADIIALDNIIQALRRRPEIASASMFTQLVPLDRRDPI